MTPQYIFSQILFAVFYAVLGLTYLVKNRKFILVLGFVALVIEGIAFVLLSAWSGLAMCAVAMIRNIIFLIQNHNNPNKKISALDYLILAALYLISIRLAIETYQGFLSLFSVFATMLYTFSVWQKNTKVYKIMGAATSILWIIYYIFVWSFVPFALEVFLLIFEVVGSIQALKSQKLETQTQALPQEKTGDGKNN